jgi:hypothetical protein
LQVLRRGVLAERERIAELAGDRREMRRQPAAPADLQRRLFFDVFILGNRSLAVAE